MAAKLGFSPTTEENLVDKKNESLPHAKKRNVKKIGMKKKRAKKTAM